MRTILRLTVLGLLTITAGAVFLAEGALHIWEKPVPWTASADAIAGQTGAAWADVKVTAADGAVLDGWMFTPRRTNGAGVILLHGVGDTRLGMMGHADFLLRAGYSVLVPDCRGHGASGGEVISYGIREADDVRAWADLMMRGPGIERLYGLGQSMGAAILLESLAKEKRFRALVADCPFATFSEIAYDRLAQRGAIGRIVSWPVVPLGLAYARVRYGINLWQASPAEAIRTTQVPVLLIHGARDTNIAPRHSRELHAVNPSATELWEVAGAEHVASLGTTKQEYVRRVTAWFEIHR